MACLVDLNSNDRCYLYASHSFGRLEYSVNSALMQPDISKFHAIIEWEDGQWLLSDISRNGVWLNKKRIDKYEKYPLALDDQIDFSKYNTASFQVENLNSPCDLLIPLVNKESEQVNAVELRDYTCLPSENNPEVVAYYDKSKYQWMLEYNVQNNETPVTLLNDGQRILLLNRPWVFQRNILSSPTEKLDFSSHLMSDLTFIFYLSQDEESTQMKVIIEGEELDLKERSHHYLLLNLARHKAFDARSNLSATEQGWVYNEKLAQELGLPETHINIQIHRIRKQMITSLANVLDITHIIERCSGRIRLGASRFQVFKGGRLECEMNYGQCRKLA